MKKWLLLLTLTAGGYFYTPVQAQSPERYTDTVRFELVNGVMVVPAQINGITADFIFDTGGRNIISADSAQKFGVTIQGAQTVSDANNLAATFQSGILPQLQVSPSAQEQTAPVMVMPPNPFFRELGVAGILGPEAYKSVCVTIDFPSRNLIISHPYRPRGISREAGTSFEGGNNSQPVIPVTLGGRRIPVLFDTGMRGFLHLSASDYQTIQNAQDIHNMEKGRGIFRVGVGGFSGASQEEVNRVTVDAFTFYGKTFTRTGTLTEKRQISIIGADMLRFGKVILDFPRELFYFFPYDDQPVDMEAHTRVWNVKILPVGDHYQITAVIGESGVTIGERVWSIEGHSLAGQPLDEGLITRILDGLDMDQVVINIGPDENSLRQAFIKKI